jgi:3-hydroxyisobutyrate dehydrogenase-like beta-hydroxyacid dehydrogenase
LCVTDEPDVLQVLKGGLLDGMNEGGVLVIHSTVRPEGCEMFARMAAPHKVGVLDAPLCGGPYAAERGTLPIPVGGDEVLFRRCLPLFEAYGELIRHCGAVGSGQRVKLVFNLLYAANVEIIHHALEVGTGWGVERDTLVRFFTAFPYRGFVGGALATGLTSIESIRHNREMLLKDITYVLDALDRGGKTAGRLGDLARESLASLEAYT